MKKILIILLPILLYACVSQSEPMDQEFETTASPSWISQHPEDTSAYYIGISGADTGNQAEDKEVGYQKALTALASAISTNIQSSSSFQESVSNDELIQSSLENSINTSVAQNLQDIETVDSYYSPETGYWFYLRLSRDKWDEVVESRAEDLKDMVEDLFFETFRDSLSELKTINRAMNAYYEAYSGKPIKMELLNQRGSVNNILIQRADALLEEMSIQWAALPQTFQQGQPVKITGQVVLSNEEGNPTFYENPGPLTLLLIDQDDRVVAEIATERDGIFDLDIKEIEKYGEMTYTLTLESPFGDSPLTAEVDYRFPSTIQQVKVNPMIIGFELQSNWSSYGLQESAFNALKDLSPVTLTSDPTEPTAMNIRTDISFRQAPPNDFGMIFSYARGYVSFVDNSGEQILWESEEFKEAGLTEEQANQKAAASLLEAMQNDEELASALKDLDF